MINMELIAATLSTPQGMCVAIGTLIVYLVGRCYVKKEAINGELVSAVKDANRTYSFHNIKEEYSFIKEYRDEEYFRSAKLLNYLDKIFCDDIQTYGKLVTHIKENREMEGPYQKMIEDAFCTPLNYGGIPFIYRSVYRKVQKREAKRLIQKPVIDSRFVVTFKCNGLEKTTTLFYDNLLVEMEIIKKKLSDKERKKYERSILTDRLRYKILRRDKFKCVLCGRGTYSGAVLHVDHILPISKGGKTEWNNLRTLCEQCNLGKGDMIEYGSIKMLPGTRSS